MRARIQKYWEATRSSYWFIPMLMAIGAILLSIGTTTVDGFVGDGWIDRIGWLYANKPGGARDLLSTIAGSMIGVAGVTFSITIASVSYATSQFGPRLLTNFMQDRGNQITLGTFIATFLYCLLVLRTIRSPDEGDALGFVPQLAVLCGLILALASIGVLIFFVHHVPESIHASNVVAGIGRELNKKIEHLFPESLGYGPSEQSVRRPEEDAPPRLIDEALSVRAGGAGYVQYIDEKGLLETARTHDLVVRLEQRPGDFVTHRRTVALVWPARRAARDGTPTGAEDGKDDDENDIAKAVRGAFAWGPQRTQTQDVLFLVNELVEIASRALSPGTNDPFTAMTCFDWLGSALSNLAGRRLPSGHRYDEDGELRVLVRPISFEDFAEQAFEPPLPYVAADRNAAIHMMKTIAEVGLVARADQERRCLARHARRLKEAAEEALAHEADREALHERYRITTRLLREPEADGIAAADRHAWLGGSG